MPTQGRKEERETERSEARVTQTPKQLHLRPLHGKRFRIQIASYSLSTEKLPREVRGARARRGLKVYRNESRSNLKGRYKSQPIQINLIPPLALVLPVELSPG